jgi:Uma2 family endonuclease
MYRELPSMRAYVLVSQHARHVEQFVRQPDDRWLLSEARGGQLALTTLSVTLDLDELYRGVGIGLAPTRSV